MQFLFGSGVFWGTPLTDANGAAISVPTPIQLGIMQDISIDISFDTKELYGQGQFPVAVGRGKGKMSGKAKVAQVNGNAINSLVFGQGMSSGITSDVYDVTGVAVPASGTLSTVVIAGTAGQFTCGASTLVPGQVLTISGTLGGTGTITGYSTPTSYLIGVTNGTTSFTLTTLAGAAIVTTAGTPTGLTYTLGPSTAVSPPNSGTWAYDLGVRNSQGIPMTRVISAPITGQYTVAAGVYSFAAADIGQTMFISYQYTAVSTTAKKGVVQNVLMGQAPTFKGDLYVPYGGKSLILTIPQCISSKFTIATKQDDFVIPEFDFSGFADAAGNALYWAVTEA